MQQLSIEFTTTEDKIERAFRRFHRENPHVYQLLCKYADEAIAAGRTRLSTKMLFERIRWYTHIETRGEDLKLNNNYTAHYARLWLRDHPTHPEFFATRKVRAK
jgi:hypothetical protein